MNALVDASKPSSTSDIDISTIFKYRVAADLNSEIGESVGYEHIPTRQWFVLRILYSRIKAAHDLLEQKEITWYQPLRYEVRRIKGKQRFRRTYFFPNLIFAYIEPENIDQLIRDKRDNTVLSYYYNHFATNQNGKNPPLTVPIPAMDNFIRLTSIQDQHIRIVDPKACRYKRGDMVIVTEGKFKGIVGRLARVSQEQRVVVNLEGVGMIASAYIPTAIITSLDNWQNRIE